MSCASPSRKRSARPSGSTAEGERIIEKAQEEAERIVAKAQEQAAFLIDERGLTQSADAQSRQIIGDAHRDADEIRRGADEYAVGVLVGLEADVVKTLRASRRASPCSTSGAPRSRPRTPRTARAAARPTAGRTRRQSRPTPAR